MCLGAARRRADGCLQIVADAERRSLVGEGALPCAAVGPVRRGLDAMGLDGWERGFAYMRICDGGRVRGSVAGLRFGAPKNRGYLALRVLSALWDKASPSLAGRFIVTAFRVFIVEVSK